MLETLADQFLEQVSFFIGTFRRTKTGNRAAAMGLGQFMPSSYRAYAADYDKDGFIDIWSNRSDAIWSVGNYLSEHGWKPGDMITVRARAAQGHNADVVNQKLKPEMDIGQFAYAGIMPMSVSFAEDTPATAMRLEGNQGTEFWLGLHNFYVITRYNHSKLYAMAVVQLAEESRKTYQSSL